MKRAGRSAARYPSRFDLAKIAPAIRKSPLRLRDWLNLHIPGLWVHASTRSNPPAGSGERS